MGRGTGLLSIAGVTGGRAPRPQPVVAGVVHPIPDRSPGSSWQAADLRGPSSPGCPGPTVPPQAPLFGVAVPRPCLSEVGAICRSTQSPAPFPQARSPFEAFPSFTAVPRHRGRFPLDVSSVGPVPNTLLPARRSPVLRPSSSGLCSMNESVAPPTRER